MSSENPVVRKFVIQELKELCAFSVENPLRPGTPDVAFIGGWMELKDADHYPVGDRPFKLDHFTPQQRVFATKWEYHGGHCLLLLRVAKSYWYLFSGFQAAQHLGKDWTGRDLLENAFHAWAMKPPRGSLLDAVRDYLSRSPLDLSELDGQKERRS